jgi:transposase
VAVAALRSAAGQEVIADGHARVLKVWAKRRRDLSRARNQAVCRLHALLCELIPGGVADEITAGQATRLLSQISPSEPVAQARCELAAELLADIRYLDGRRREARTKLAAAVKASGTSLTEVFGVGPVIAATVIGDVVIAARFPTRDHFAACNGTAPVEVSSGEKKIYRLSLRGNRRLNHAIHMAAITQIRHKHSDGRAYYERKIAQGKAHKEALRCRKRRISDAIYARLRADARQATAACAKDPGGQPGNHSVSRAAGSHPARRLFGQATPRAWDQPTRRGSAHTGHATRAAGQQNPANHLTTTTTKRIRSGRATWIARVTVVTAPERLFGSRPGANKPWLV